MPRPSVPSIAIDGVRIVPGAVWPKRPLDDGDFVFQARCVRTYPHEYVGVVYLADDDTPLGETTPTRDFAAVAKLANDAVRQVTAV
jgi:hypothetical protein